MFAVYFGLNTTNKEMLMTSIRSYITIIRAISDHLPEFPDQKIEIVLNEYNQDWRTFRNLEMLAWQIENAIDYFEEGEIDISKERFSALICGLVFGNVYYKLDNGGRRKGWLETENSRRGFMAANEFGLSDHARLVQRMIAAKENFTIITDPNSAVEDATTIGWYLDLNLLHAIGTNSSETQDRAIRLRDEFRSTLSFEEFVNSRAKWANAQLARGPKLFTQLYMSDSYGEYARRVLLDTKDRQLLAA